ncbi:MAG: toll/interleukin-1 receptor domain-containing protein, partial [Pseudomonadota bacterium]
MPGIFISHSSRDNQVADEVAQRLRQQGFQSLFLDFDPADGIPAGRNWEQELYGQLRRCSGVVLLCSEHSMASDWCFAEITHARA